MDDEQIRLPIAEFMISKLCEQLSLYHGQINVLLAQFLIDKYKEIIQIIRQEEMEAFRTLEKIYEQVNALMIPSIKQRYIMLIQAREKHIIDTVDKLCIRLESIIDENLE